MFISKLTDTIPNNGSKTKIPETRFCLWKCWSKLSWYPPWICYSHPPSTKIFIPNQKTKNIYEKSKHKQNTQHKHKQQQMSSNFSTSAFLWIQFLCRFWSHHFDWKFHQATQRLTQGFSALQATHGEFTAPLHHNLDFTYLFRTALQSNEGSCNQKVVVVVVVSLEH